jgi:hypothetical protein
VSQYGLVPQPEQPPRILPADFHPIVLADRAGVEPDRGVVDVLFDDYNVDRFRNLLDEMTRSTDTRFIIITHNPITMARMNRLYGVTMAERGVSQLVSVDLEGAVKLREAS